MKPIYQNISISLETSQIEILKLAAKRSNISLSELCRRLFELQIRHLVPAPYETSQADSLLANLEGEK